LIIETIEAEKDDVLDVLRCSSIVLSRESECNSVVAVAVAVSVAVAVAV